MEQKDLLAIIRYGVTVHSDKTELVTCVTPRITDLAFCVCYSLREEEAANSYEKLTQRVRGECEWREKVIATFFAVSLMHKMPTS